MGGNLFDGTRGLSIDELAIVKLKIPSLMNTLGVTDYAFVGSAMGSGPCGDIDIATTSMILNARDERTRIFQVAQRLYGRDYVRRSGQLISVSYPVPGREERCQLDIIPCNNLQDARWLLRGLFRHMLFALVAKDMTERMVSDDCNVRVTMSIPDGLRITVNDDIVANTSHPLDILSHLEFPDSVRPYDVLSLSGLASAVAIDRSRLLARYPEYVYPLRDKRGYEEALTIVSDARYKVHM